MTTAYLPVALPPSGVVAAVSPAAAKAIDKVHRLDASLPPRRDAEQCNQLDELRGSALVELGDKFFTALDVEDAELRETLRQEIEQLRGNWARLEAIQGLRDWRRQPQNYAPRQIPCMAVPSGAGGYNRPIFGRQVITALSDTVQRRR